MQFAAGGFLPSAPETSLEGELFDKGLSYYLPFAGTGLAVTVKSAPVTRTVLVTISVLTERVTLEDIRRHEHHQLEETREQLIRLTVDNAERDDFVGSGLDYFHEDDVGELQRAALHAKDKRVILRK